MPDVLEPSSHLSQHKVREQLLQQLDAFLLIQIGAIFCLDNSTAFLLIRFVTQLSFVSPRPEPLRANPQLVPIICINLFILIVHLFHDGGSIGYSHGSILVDFVGELGPISRWRLFFLDILVFTVQAVSLAIGFEHRKIQEKKGQSTQDIVAEEAGARRSQDGHMVGDSVELQDPTEGHPSDRVYPDHTAISLDVILSLKALAREPAAASTADAENGAMSSVLSTIMSRTAQP